MPRWIFAFLQFLPLSLFITYATWHGAPDGRRWGEAFQLAALAAVLQLALLLPQKRPTSRLILAANLYLLIGGLAVLTGQTWVLVLYETLRESAIFLLMLVVGTVATLATPPGYIGATDVPRGVARWYSMGLLAATLAALAMSVAFRGDRYLAAVIPIVGLAVLQRVLLRRAAAAGIDASRLA